MIDKVQLQAIIEGLILAADKPLSEKQILAIFSKEEKPSLNELREAIFNIQEACIERGFELVELASGYTFQVKVDLLPWVGKLWHEKPQKYTRAFLETLALIAYRQPITRGEIEAIRGVAVSSHMVKGLEDRGWIRTVGHRDVPGRPALLATTAKFLDYFGLKSLEELPAVAEIMQEPSAQNYELPLEEHMEGLVEEGKESIAVAEETVLEEDIVEHEAEDTPETAQQTKEGKSLADLARSLNDKECEEEVVAEEELALEED